MSGVSVQTEANCLDRLFTNEMLDESNSPFPLG